MENLFIGPEEMDMLEISRMSGNIKARFSSMERSCWFSLNPMILFRASALFYNNLNVDFCPNSVDEPMTQVVSCYVKDNRV
jgi:hypothetical protein